MRIVRERDIIDVDPGIGVDLRTVGGPIRFTNLGTFGATGGEDGRAISFNDDGLLVYQLNFTDGSSGIFTTQLTPVPEPTTVLLAAGLLLAAGCGCRRAWRGGSQIES